MNKKIIVLVIMTLFITSVTFSAFGNETKKEEKSSSFAEVLDQQQTWSDECKYVDGSEWQQFVPTLDNLNRVEVKVGQWFSGSPDMEVTIEKPLGNVLTSAKMPATSIPSDRCGWVSFNVPDITLIPGTGYYIRVIAPRGSEYGWGIAYNDLYPLGISSQRPADWCFKTYGYYRPKIPGLSFSTVDFMIKGKFQDSDWGHLKINIEELTSHFEMNQGYLNIYSDDGWIIPNMFIDRNEYVEEISTYLRLSQNEKLQEFSAYVDFLESPAREFKDGPRVFYNVSKIIYNADGLGPERRSLVSLPPAVYEFIPELITWDFTKPLLEGENVDAAWNQCAPMGVANSLQYLENSYASITVPHVHKLGQDGDNSLVGQLDAAMARTVSSRISGSGCNCPQILEGKFEYLDDNGLAVKVVNKHQGYGYFGMPAGDYTAHGITSKDESASGGIVTFDWIYEQLQNCEDVEVGIKWGGGGGHMVRIYGCGRTNGKPYLRFAHDRTQAYSFKPDGVTCYGDGGVGLECAQVYVEDLDGDGMMNWGSRDDEIVFAMSESPRRLRIIDIWSQLGIYVLIVNDGEEQVNVDWSIEVEAPLMFFGGRYFGDFEIPPGEEHEIKTGFFFGFGPAKITVKLNDMVQIWDCFLFGPFALGIS